MKKKEIVSEQEITAIDPIIVPTCKEILAEWLKEHGFDGLYDEGNSCGCSLEDFVPCGCIGLEGICMPGYRHKDGLMYSWKEMPNEP